MRYRDLAAIDSIDLVWQCGVGCEHLSRQTGLETLVPSLRSYMQSSVNQSAIHLGVECRQYFDAVPLIWCKMNDTWCSRREHKRLMRIMHGNTSPGRVTRGLDVLRRLVASADDDVPSDNFFDVNEIEWNRPEWNVAPVTPPSEPQDPVTSQNTQSSETQSGGRGHRLRCIMGCDAILVPRFVSTSHGRNCHSCNVLRGARARIWVCPTCERAFCPTCRKSGGLHSGSAAASSSAQVLAPHGADNIDLQEQQEQAAVSPHEIVGTPVDAEPNIEDPDLFPYSGYGRSHTAGFITKLLCLLEQLPEVAPLSTYAFLPKGLTRRYVKLATVAIEWFVSEIEKGSALHSPERARAAALFLKHLDFIIARDVSHGNSSNGVEAQKESEASSVNQVVRERLQLLEQGKWLELLALVQVDCAAAAHGAATRRTVAGSDDAEALKAQRYESCVFKCTNGDVRTAHRILKSNGLHPPCDETVKLMASKFVTEPQRDSMAHKPGLLQRARRCKAPKVHQKLVSKVVANMSDCRAAGTTAWRASRLKGIAADEHGLRALTRWTQSWVSGLVPEIMACHWRTVLGVPLRKGDAGDDVRPILISEALTSLPGACLQEITRDKVQKLLLPSQFGIGVAAGAESMVLQGKVLASLCPDDAFCAFDMRNAFGEISRAEIMEEVLAEVPELAPFLVSLWGEAGTPIVIAVGSGEWARITLLDGLFQGHNLSTLLFCLGLRRAMRRFEADYVAAGFAIEKGLPIRMEYIDDMLMKLPADLTDAWLPLLQHALGTVSLSLNLSKCKGWIPSARGDANPSFLRAGLPQVFGHLEVLGSALDGAHSAVLGSSDAGIPPASSTKRLQAALSLADKIRDMLAVPLSRPVRRAAWTLLDKVLNKALDYDARILHPEVFSILAKRLDCAVQETATKIVDAPLLQGDDVSSLRLSASRGGCDIVSAEVKSSFAHMAAACQCLPGVAQRLMDLGFDRQCISAAVDLSGVACCMHNLQALNIYLRFDGAVISGERPSTLLAPEDFLWTQARKLHSSLLDAVQGNFETTLRFNYAASERDLARLNSCCGPVSSRWLTEFPSSWWPVIHDDKFITAIRFRLGLPLGPAGCRCMHAPSKDPEKYCDAGLDRFGDHAVTCNIGPHVFARHAAVNELLAQAGREAGYAGLLEQVVPELGLRQRKRDGRIVLEEARLDVDLFGHATAPDRLLDATVRHPAAAHILRKAARMVGAAAAEGVDAKTKRYPPRAGKSVIACAVETWGHVHGDLHALLADLGVLAAQRQRDRGVQPTRWLARWRTQLSIQLALQVSKAILNAYPAHVRPCCVIPVTDMRR